MGTVTYNSKFAMRYGINAAILANQIEFLQVHTTRKDGFCWRSQDELFKDTGLTPRMQRLAIELLVENELLTTKNTMIIGTAIKCKHYKLTEKYIADRANDFIGYDDLSQPKPKVTKRNNRKLQNVTTESDEKSQSVNSNKHSNQHSSKENTKRKSDELEERFAKFWKAYPKKVGKETAKKAFIKLSPKDSDIDLWISAIERQKTTRQWRDPQYIPYPSTWLNGKRWEDLPDTPVTGIEYEHDTDDLSFFK